METNDNNTYDKIDNESQTEEKTPIQKYHRIALITIIFVSFVMLTPILLFYFITDQSRNYLRSDNYTCLVDDNYKISCGKPTMSYLECTTSSCCFNFTSNLCYHYLPSKYFYSLSGTAFSSSQNLTPFLNIAIPDINFVVNPVDKENLEINLNSQSVPISTPAPTLAPTTTPVQTDNDIEDKTYFTKEYNGRLGVEVYRSDTNDSLLSTLKGPLIASSGYWEWNVYIKNEILFGFGEMILEKNITISKVIYKNKNDHNTLPIFMSYLNKRFHGLYIKSDGPLEVTILPSHLIILKSLAGNRITLNLCTGPTPKMVRKQQQQLFGYKPIKLPYWSLGVHVCRDGIITSIDSAITEYKKFVEANKNKIEFSSDCIHEALYSFLGKLEPEEKKHLEELLKNLQTKSQFMMSVSPHIFKDDNLELYDKAESLDINYKYKNGSYYEGNYLINRTVVYPDFEHNNIQKWLTEFLKMIPTDRHDGFVLKDNWLTDDNYIFLNEEYTFPYITKDINTSMSNSMSWDAIAPRDNKQHILKHNQYGALQVQAYLKQLESDTKPHPFIITSSYDYGISQASAQIQNVDISWINFKKAISTTLYNSIFGNPFITIPVCGSTDKFNKKLDELLCIRWYLAAATFPVFRISSDLPRRDPVSLPTKFASRIASNAIKQRFKLLPYFYTVLSSSEPLVRPLLYDYHLDNETLNLDEQYMLGNALLVAQPVTEPTFQLSLYLPPVETWYEFWGGQKSNSTGWVELHIVETDWIMYIAAGHIVPYRNMKSIDRIIGSHDAGDTFGVAIALKCVDGDSCNAEGYLRHDEGVLYFFEATKTENDLNFIIELTVSIAEVKNDIHLGEITFPSILDKATIYGINDNLFKECSFNIDLCTISGSDKQINRCPIQKQI